MDTYLRTYSLPQGNGFVSRLRYRLSRMSWIINLSWDRGPCKVKLDVPAPEPGKKDVVVMAQVSRIFASRIDEFVAPFDRNLRGNIAFAVGAMIFAVCFVFGGAAEGLVAGGAVGIFLAMLFNG